MWLVGLLSVVLAQGKVTPAGALATARFQHTATLLADGRVLVTGGRSADTLETLASTELFDPRRSVWSPGPPLSARRAGHTATLLLDGRVLVVGGTAPAGDGSNRFDSLSSAEVFDPAQKTWTTVSSMAEARNGHTASRLADGSVLVVGGARPVHHHLSSVERFDPVANRFASSAPLARGRWLHDAVVLHDGSVVVLGGRSNQGALEASAPRPGAPIDGVERFDVAANEWRTGPSLTEPRQRTAVVAIGNRVVVFGGQSALMSTNYVEWWEPQAPQWTPLSSNLSVPIAGHTASLLPSGDVLIVGGEPPSAVDTGRIQRWVAAAGTWCLAGTLKTSRKSHTATVLRDGSVLVVGGTSAGLAEASAERWTSVRGACVEP